MKDKEKRRRLREHIREANKKKVNRTDPDPHSAELGRRLGTQPEVNPFFAYTNISTDDLMRLQKRKMLVSREDILTKRFVAQEEEIDKDRDIAGPVAIERALLFLRALTEKMPGRLTHNDILVFMLVTGPLAISILDVSKLMNHTKRNVQHIVEKLIKLDYIAISVTGGPSGPRKNGKMISTTYYRTDRGEYLWKLITHHFDTRKLGAIADMVNSTVRNIPVPALVKARQKQVDIMNDLPIDIPEPNN